MHHLLIQRMASLGYRYGFPMVHYNRFIGLGNPLEVVAHHLLIERMASLGYRDGFPMVSALVCMVIHWTGLTVSHDLTKLLHCVSLNLERILSLC